MQSESINHSADADTLSATPQLGVAGLGLIGGSLAKALRDAFPLARIIAADADYKALEAASGDDCVDEAIIANNKGEFLRFFEGCDFLFLCAPPSAVEAQLSALSDLNIGLVTDVASVKLPVMKAAAGLANFVGGHPMAGSEGSGFAASDAGLFQGASYILCAPDDFDANDARLARLERIIAAIGAKPIRMDAEAHDRRMALISHLPHAAAFALAASPALRGDPLSRSLIGGGFRDTTRIAASAPPLWADIFMESRFLPEAIDALADELRALRDLIAGGDKPALEAFLRSASDFRKTIPEGLRAASK